MVVYIGAQFQSTLLDSKSEFMPWLHKGAYPKSTLICCFSFQLLWSKALMAIAANEIGFDLDGVIADTAESFLSIACSKYGYCSFTREDITNFELESCMPIPRDIVDRIFTEILTDSLATGLKPMKGAVETLTLLARESTITIITARPLLPPVLDWIDAFFPAGTRDTTEVIATGDHNDKVRHIHKRGLKYFVDDRAETCLQLANADIIPLVFSQPWNRNRHNLQCVENWADIRKLITTSPRRLSEGK